MLGRVRYLIFMKYRSGKQESQPGSVILNWFCRNYSNELDK